MDRTWSTTDYLLAHVVDLLQVSNYQFALANSRHRPAQKPKPLPRPRDVAPRRDRQWMGRTLYTPKE